MAAMMSTFRLAQFASLEAFKDRDLAPFKLLHLWVPDHRRFCVHPFREEFLFPTTLWISRK